MKNRKMFKQIGLLEPFQLDLKEWVALILAIFNLFALVLFPLDAWVHRVTYFTLSIIIVLLTHPGFKKFKFIDKMISVFLILSMIGIWLHAITGSYNYLSRAGVVPNTLDAICGLMLVIISLEVLRRVSGPLLPIIGIAFILFALFGNYLPGIFCNKGFAFSRVVTIIYSPSGIFSLMGVVVTYVFVFVTLGAFITECGMGKTLIQLSCAIVGRTIGGPAKIAVVASGLLGTITGSSTANVLTTGAFTIPMMKEAGYKSRFAAAVEAVASTGGQIMPPVMGTAAFIMAELIGMPYSKIALAAIIPALLYYISVFWMVDITSRKMGLATLSENQIPIPNLKKIILTEGYLTLPLFLLIYLLFIAKTSPVKAGLLAIVSCVLVSFVRTPMGLKKIIRALISGATSASIMVAIIGVAGIIVATLNLTGLGLKLIIGILFLAEGNLFLSLILVAIVVLFLGMGLPTAAAYIIAATVAAPVLMKIGFPALAAHFFIFYYACISSITPPTCLAAYAAATLAQEDPMKVGWTAVRLGMAALIIPFVMVYYPALLLIGTFPEILLASISTVVIVLALGCALMGYVVSEISIFERGVLALGILLILLRSIQLLLLFIGILMIGSVFVINIVKSKKKESH